MDLHLQRLEQKSIYILRETKVKFKNAAVLWDGGKDPTTGLYLCKRAFFGKIPFPAIHIETGHIFPETRQFREKISKELGVDFFVINDGLERNRKEYARKNSLRKLINDHKFDALIVSLSEEEKKVKPKKKYFSLRRKKHQNNHNKHFSGMLDCISEIKDIVHIVYPFSCWKEIDVWMYIKEKNIPARLLYFTKDGERYQIVNNSQDTIPLSENTKTVDKIIEELKIADRQEKNVHEEDKTYIVQRLKDLGYM